MPVNCNPRARAFFSLRCDRETPEKERPEFLVKFMTADEKARYQQAVSDLNAAGEPREVASRLLEAIQIGVTGWRNVRREGKELAFTPENLLAALTIGELFELAYQYPGVVSLTAADYANFASPSPTDTAASVSGGQTESAGLPVNSYRPVTIAPTARTDPAAAATAGN